MPIESRVPFAESRLCPQRSSAGSVGRRLAERPPSMAEGDSTGGVIPYKNMPAPNRLLLWSAFSFPLLSHWNCRCCPRDSGAEESEAGTTSPRNCSRLDRHYRRRNIRDTLDCLDSDRNLRSDHESVDRFAVILDCSQAKALATDSRIFSKPVFATCIASCIQ